MKRLPNEDELPALLATPLPRVTWDGYSRQIKYQKTSGRSYQLMHATGPGFLADIAIYDSLTPTRGWYRIPF